MRSARQGPVLCTLALSAVAAAYAGDSTSERPLGAASLPPLTTRQLAASDGPACPLSVGKQVQAVHAFREMLPVFRHARCLNCHGGLDVMSERHPGASQLDTDNDPRAFMGREERDSVSEMQCTTCHDNIRRMHHRDTMGGWMIPAQGMFFVHEDGSLKSDEDMCKMMKAQETPGERFVSHIRDDHETIQFIEAGFAGDRALGDEELQRLGLSRESPAGNQAEMTRKAQKWVDLLGHGYQASPECGCVLPKIKLGIHHTMANEVPNGIPSNVESEVKFELELEPMGDDKPGMFAGQQVLTREIQVTVPAGCKATGSQRERWVVYAYVDLASGEVNTWRNLVQEDPKGKIVCREAGGERKWDLQLGASLSMLAFNRLNIPPDSGSKTVTEEDGGERESLTITVLEARPNQ